VRNPQSPRPPRARRGLTLIELTLALTIFSVLGYSLMSALTLSNNSRAAVESMVEESEQLRSGARALTADLRISSEAHVAIAELADGNHELSLQLPITVGGELGWGVPARALETAGEADHEGWTVRYTVIVDADAEQGMQRSLVRQIVDGAAEVKKADVLVQGLTKGSDASPGFKVELSGDVWEVTLSTEKGAGKREVFHVHSRN